MTTTTAPRPSTAQVVLACIRRDTATVSSYRLPFAMGVLTGLFTLVLFFYLGRLVDAGAVSGMEQTHGGYFAFAIVGIALLRMVQSALTAFTTNLRQEQSTGTLEALLSCAASPAQVIAGSAAYLVLRATVEGLVLLVAAVPFGLRPDVTVGSALAAAAGVVGLMGIFAALGILVAAFTVTFKQAGPLSALVATGLSLLGGVYFPVDLLPAPVELAANALPFTWGVDVVRAGLVTGQVEQDRLLLLVVATVVSIPLALWVFGLSIRQAKRRGTLGHY